MPAQRNNLRQKIAVIESQTVSPDNTLHFKAIAERHDVQPIRRPGNNVLRQETRWHPGSVKGAQEAVREAALRGNLIIEPGIGPMVGESLEHAVNAADADHAFAGFRPAFTIFAQAPGASINRTSPAARPRCLGRCRRPARPRGIRRPCSWEADRSEACSIGIRCGFDKATY